MQRGKKIHQIDPYDLDDPFNTFGHHDLGVVDRDFLVMRQKFTEDDVWPITNWVISVGNFMERTVWMFTLAGLATGLHVSPAELAEDIADFYDISWQANYRQTRIRLREKLLRKFTSDEVLVKFIRVVFPEHENKRKPRKPKATA